MEADDTKPGLYITNNTQINWIFTIQNNGEGNITLTQMTLINIEGEIIPDCIGTSIAHNEIKICTATSIAKAGQQSYNFTVSAKPPGAYPSVNRTKQVYYYGSIFEISDENPINSSTDVDRPPSSLNVSIEYLPLNDLDVYFYWRNHENIWILLDDYHNEGSGCYEYIPLGTDWIWGNTAYVWSVNV